MTKAAKQPARRATHNAEIARLLNETADLLELQQANRFRIRAYRNAARTIEELPRPVLDLPAEGRGSLDDLPGIGEDLAGKIREIASTGRLKLLKELERKTPRGLPELTRLRGLGPAKAVLLREKLGIRSLAGLERAARAGKVRTLKGFGAKTEAKLLHELAFHRSGENRMLRAVAAQYGDALVEYLREGKGVGQVELAGSFRRGRETVGDLDVLVTAKHPATVVKQFVAYPEVAEVLTHGTTGASVRLHSGLQVDLRVLEPASFGAGLYYFTGSKAHNIAARRLAQARGLKLNEYGVFRGTRRVAGRTEREVARAVGLPWIPPELREDRGEIEAAHARTLPKPVDLEAIRGDLHCHTTSSDGRDTLAAMVAAAKARGYQYLAITDHTPALRMVQGLDAAGFRRQGKAVDRINAHSRGITVLKGAEVDIHRDGTLDLGDAALDALDLVLVSVHSHFDLSEREQTRRVIRAIRHPAVQILAHPTGRLIGTRGPIQLDLPEIYRVAAAEGVLLEINAQPARLDLDDVAVHAAIDHGVTLVISTDAHAVAELGFMRWGVDQARRGWAEAGNIANTRTLASLLTLVRR